mmetsp:Transcript_8246/g.9742  ORF Transcript_8246/g.9742 Transcript_8246/m.9742 type:complete len:166 (+) Transcript_8246:140-637(+)
MRNRILNVLRGLVWPAVSSRSRLNAECYMSVSMQNPPTGPEYVELYHLLTEILTWVDPTYVCTHVAVTKNFVGSPHVDRSDKAFQFALGVGEYIGGELVIESESHEKLYVVDTHDRIVKIDGRRLHWVRGFQGERYSLVFFCLDTNNGTALSWSVYQDFVPDGTT